MPRERTYRWYVEPLDANTNDVLYRANFEEAGEKECSDGRKRRVWQARGYADIAYLQKSRTIFGLKFIVYLQEREWRLCRWPFPKSKKIGR